MNCEVVLKVLNCQVCDVFVVLFCFICEVTFVGCFNYSNIIIIYDVGCVEDGMLFMVMELLYGCTL